MQAPVPPLGYGGHPCHTESMSHPPNSQVPCTKDRAPSLQTLTHFSVNGFPNASHAWNKPLTTGPPPDLPSPALLIRPPAPALPPQDAPRAAHRRRVSKQPGIPGLAPAGRKPSPAEHTHPNSGAEAAAFLADWREATFSQRPAQGHTARAGNLPGVFPGGSSPLQPVHGGTASTAGGILRARRPPFGLSSIAPASEHPTEPRAQREETSLSSQRKEIKITRRWRYRGIWPRSQNKSAALRYSHPTHSVSGHKS